MPKLSAVPNQPSDRKAVEGEVETFLVRRAQKVLGETVPRDTALFTSGLLDSLTFLEMVLFVEEKFGVRLFHEMDVCYEALDSIEKVAEAVARARG